MLGLANLILALALAAPPVQPVFVARSAGGPALCGTLSHLDPDLAVALAGTKAGDVPAGELISLRQKDVPLPPPPSGPHVVFANGDRLAGEVAAIENEHVRFKATLGREAAGDGVQELSIPLSALAVIWFQAPPADAGADLARRFARERRRRDIVLTKNGDQRSGSIRSMKPSAQLTLDEDGKETRLDAGQLVAIAMNTDLARTLRPRGAHARLVLANGGRLSVLAPSAGSVTLSARTLFGESVKISLDQLVSLDVRQGKAVYLSDLRPKGYEHHSYLGVSWPYEMDHSVAGNELRLGGSSYDKGIGQHSESRLSFDIGGRYRRFETLVGLDDRTGQGGRVLVRVLVDGKPRDIGAAELNSAAGPRPIEVDVAGARELTLVVEFGPGGDVCDHVDWADARLVK